MNNRFGYTNLWLATLLLCVVAPCSLLAQETEKEEKKDESVVLEEMTVTATKRATPIQKTPIAITALGQEQLDRNQVRNLTDMVTLVPSLHIGTHGDSNSLDVTLRGVGSTNRTELGDPAVAFHVNDVYSPRPQGAAVLMYDVERVEVHRGPQGTLSGRNSTVGTVSIHTVKPNFDGTDGNLAITAGNYDRQAIKGAFNQPLSDRFAIRFAAYSDRHDAYVDSLSNYVGYYPGLTEDSLDEFQKSDQVGFGGYEAGDYTSWRLSGLYNITDNITWFTTFEHFKDNGTGYLDLDPFLVNQGHRVAVTDSPGSIDMTNQSFTSRLDITMNKLDFSYILGLGDQKRSQVWDADLGRGTAFQEDRTEWSNYDFQSHELQLKNKDDSRLRWIVGLYSSAEDNAIRFDIDHVDNSPQDGAWVAGGWSWIDGGDGGGAAFIQPDRQLESQAVYAHATFDVTDSIRFTGGARYIQDEKSDRGGRSINCGPFIRGPRVDDTLNGEIPDDIYEDPNIQNGATDNGSNQGIGSEDCWVRQVNDSKEDWDKVTWLARYEQDFGKKTMFYASIGTGFKSGVIGDAGLSAEPEETTNTEIGLKTTLLGGRLRINSSLYHMDYENLQISRPQVVDNNGDGVPDGQGSLVTVNAAEATIDGLEIELEAIVGEYGRFTAVSTFLDATYDEFDRDENVFGQNQPWNPPSDGALGDIGFVNLAGNTLIRAPEYEFTLAYEHSFVTSSGTWRPRLQAALVDDTFLDEFNRTDLVNPNGTVIENYSVQPAYEQIDFSLAYNHHSSSWHLDFFVQNATDEDIRTAVAGFTGLAGLSSYYKPPRTYGMTFGYDW